MLACGFDDEGRISTAFDTLNGLFDVIGRILVDRADPPLD
jgi:hypothetical protein